MPHIHTKPGEHDHTASAFVVRTDGDEPKILLHLHKKLNKYMQFGGHIETNETPWQALVHEIREESGYDISQFKVLQPKQRMRSVHNGKLHPIPIYHNTHQQDEDTEHYHTDIAYALVTNEDPKFEIGEAETKSTLLLTRAELVGLPSEKTLESVRQAGLFMFDVCLPEWEPADPSTFD